MRGRVGGKEGGEERGGRGGGEGREGQRRANPKEDILNTCVASPGGCPQRKE